MDYSLLPTFPPRLPSKSAVPTRGREWRLTQREARVIIDLAKLAVIVIVLAWLSHSVDVLQQPLPPPPEPLPFEVVTERFHRVTIQMTDIEVFALLGPQRFAEFREPEMDKHDRLVEYRPDRYPGEHYWAKWADPADPSRCVAVFFSGGRVYKKLKRGV